MKIVRLVVGLGLLAALFYFGLIDLRTLRQALAHPLMLALAVALATVAIPISGVRWHILLQSQGLKLQLRHTVQLTAIAAFFGTFLPGGLGGDLVRGAYIYQVSQGRQTSAILSIFIDRLIALLANVLVAVAVTLLRPWHAYGALEYSLFIMAAFFMTALGVMFGFGHQIAWLVNLLFRGRWHRISKVIDDVATALHLYSRSWASVLLALVLSLLIVALLTTSVVVVAVTMIVGGLGVFDYAIAANYAIVANSLPITPGGLGVGEGAFASACMALASNSDGVAYGTAFLVFRCALVLSTLYGLFAYWTYPSRKSLLEATDA